MSVIPGQDVPGKGTGGRQNIKRTESWKNKLFPGVPNSIKEKKGKYAPPWILRARACRKFKPEQQERNAGPQVQL